MRTTAPRILLAVAAVAVIGAGVGLWILRQHGLVSDQPPGRLETAMARRLVVLSIPAAARDRTSPYRLDGTAWRDGEAHFQEHCAFCHGTDGRGTELGRRMYPPVPSLSEPAIQAMSDGALFAVIQNGVRWTGMPAFRKAHSEDDTWKLVAFIRRVPSLTPADLNAHTDVAADSSHHTGDGPTVAIDGTAFVPSEMTVKMGERVTWVNKDPFPHNVTSSSGRFHSEDLSPDAAWSYTPARAGRFEYVCTLHPGMRGTLIVEAGESR